MSGRDLPPFPEGLPNGPDVRQHPADFRDVPIRNRDELLEKTLRHLDSVLEPDGWDQPDRLFVLMTQRSTSRDGFMWMSEANVPDEVRGSLPQILLGMCAVLSIRDREFTGRMADKILGQRPEKSIPLGLVATFESWGVSGEGTPDLSVLHALEHGALSLHPDALEQRMYVGHFYDGDWVHLTRTRGQGEPVFGKDDEAGGPVAELLDQATHLLIDAIGPTVLSEAGLN